MPMAGFDSDLKLWTDHFMCQWTNVRNHYLSISSSCLFLGSKEVPQHEAAKYFVQLNEKHLSALSKNNCPSTIITFSHFFTSRYV